MKQVVGVVSLLTLFFLSPYFYVDDPYFVAGLVLALILFWCLKILGKRFSWNYVDAGAFLFLVYDCASLLLSKNLAGSTAQFQMTGLSVFYYFVLRFWCDRPERWRILLLSYVACICLFSVLALSYFYMFQQTIWDLGFVNLYDFRFLLCPLGVVSNEWASLQLLFGGVVAVAWYYCRGKRIHLFLLFVGVLVFLQVLWSFSRGMYLSLLFLSAGMLLLLRKRLQDKSVIATLLLFMMIMGCILVTSRSDVMRTLRMTETVSQKRSIKSRLNTWTVTGDIVRDYPWGVGNGNYQIVVDRYWKGNRGNEAYASYAMNLVSQLMVEKGWGGLLLYGGTFILFSIFIIRKNERIAWLVWLFLVVYLFREQTFSAFFSSIRVRWLFFTLLAVAQGTVENNKERTSLRIKVFLNFLSVIPVIMWLLCFSTLCKRKEKVADNDSFLASVDIKEWNKVERMGERLGGSAPLLLNRALFYWNRYLETSDERVLMQAKADVREARRLNPYDVQLDFYSEMFSSGDLVLLAMTYPHKLIFSWGAYMQIEKCRNQESCYRLVDCILSDPRIMDTEYWKKLSCCDSGFVHKVSDELLRRIQNTQEVDPVILAKMGSVALKLNELDLAENCLVEALTLLPNLSMAWFNLGVVKERKGENELVLLYKKRGIILGTRTVILGDDWKRYLSTGLQNDMDGDVIQRVESGYVFRFHVWYGYQLLKGWRLPNK